METKVTTLLVAALVIFAGGYGTAMFTRPAKIEYKDKIVEVKVQDEEYVQKRIEEYKATHKEEFTVVKYKWRKVRVEVPCPNIPAPAEGCKAPCATDCNKCPKQVISIDSGSQENNAGSATTTTTGTNTTTAQGSSTTASSTEQETSKSETYFKPQWKLDFYIGLNWNAAINTSPGQLQTFVWGLSGDTRIIGPLWGGAWYMRDGDQNLGGAKLGLEF